MASNASPSFGVAPGRGAKFSGQRFAVFVALSIVMGALVGGASAVVQTYFAPLLIFPLLVGGFLGAVLTGLMRWSDVAHRVTVLLGTLLAALACTVAAHYVSYNTAQHHSKAEDDKLNLARQFIPGAAERTAGPRDFFDYLRREAAKGRELTAHFTARGPLAWISWGVDAALMALAALALVAAALRLPYCNRCCTWYRTTRSGRIPLATARELAGMVGLELPPRMVATRYRMINCEAGCGPTALELVWRIPKEGTAMATLWLDPAQRSRVQAILDAVVEVEEEEGGDEG